MRGICLSKENALFFFGADKLSIPFDKTDTPPEKSRDSRKCVLSSLPGLFWGDAVWSNVPNV